MSNIDKQALRTVAMLAKELSGISMYSKAIAAINKFHELFTPDVALALLDELEALQSFRTAFNEWHDKTEWVQCDKRFDVIKPWGKHRADVLKLYIENLESKLEAKEEQRANWFQMAQKLGEDLDAAEKRIAELEAREVKIPYLPADCDRTEAHFKYQEAIREAGIEIAAGIGKGE